jgi:hypothetical protein
LSFPAAESRGQGRKDEEIDSWLAVLFLSCSRPVHGPVPRREWRLSPRGSARPGVITLSPPDAARATAALGSPRQRLGRRSSTDRSWRNRGAAWAPRGEGPSSAAIVAEGRRSGGEGRPGVRWARQPSAAHGPGGHHKQAGAFSEGRPLWSVGARPPSPGDRPHAARPRPASPLGEGGTVPADQRSRHPCSAGAEGSWLGSRRSAERLVVLPGSGRKPGRRSKQEHAPALQSGVPSHSNPPLAYDAPSPHRSERVHAWILCV